MAGPGGRRAAAGEPGRRAAPRAGVRRLASRSSIPCAGRAPSPSRPRSWPAAGRRGSGAPSPSRAGPATTPLGRKPSGNGSRPCLATHRRRCSRPTATEGRSDSPARTPRRPGWPAIVRIERRDAADVEPPSRTGGLPREPAVRDPPRPRGGGILAVPRVAPRPAPRLDGGGARRRRRAWRGCFPASRPGRSRSRTAGSAAGSWSTRREPSGIRLDFPAGIRHQDVTQGSCAGRLPGGHDPVRERAARYRLPWPRQRRSSPLRVGRLARLLAIDERLLVAARRLHGPWRTRAGEGPHPRRQHLLVDGRRPRAARRRATLHRPGGAVGSRHTARDTLLPDAEALPPPATPHLGHRRLRGAGREPGSLLLPLRAHHGRLRRRGGAGRSAVRDRAGCAAPRRRASARPASTWAPTTRSTWRWAWCSGPRRACCRGSGSGLVGF